MIRDRTEPKTDGIVVLLADNRILSTRHEVRPHENGIRGEFALSRKQVNPRWENQGPALRKFGDRSWESMAFL